MNPTTLLDITLLIITLSASMIYFKRIKKINKEYNSSKELIKNMTLGITKNLYRNIKNLKILIELLRRDIDYALERSNKATETSEILEKNIQNIINKIEDLEKIIINIRERTSKRLTKIDTPIPIEDKKVLGSLNQTEFKILMILEELEEGTVPQIKKRINKTREHTARMLKKLYDQGYIDRNTNSTPYKYYLRREVKEIIKREAVETSSTLNV